MEYGIGQGVFSGVDLGVYDGEQFGINGGLANGAYNENRLYLENINLPIALDGRIVSLDAGNPYSYPGEFNGLIWRDISGRGNNGTLTNGPTFNHRNGGTIVFDGTNDYVAPTALTDAYWQANWSAGFWVNFDTLNINGGPSQDRTLVQHGVGGGTRSELHLCQRNNRIHFGLYSDDTTGNTNLSVNRWYNVVFTLNNTTFQRVIYLNGVNDGSATGGGAYVGTGNNTRICGVVLSFGLYFDWFLGSCIFYNRVLSPAEVLQNYNVQKSRYGL
jgi:hypothetical protein